jgi:hypothetical protein
MEILQLHYFRGRPEVDYYLPFTFTFTMSLADVKCLGYEFDVLMSKARAEESYSSVTFLIPFRRFETYAVLLLSDPVDLTGYAYYRDRVYVFSHRLGEGHCVR